MTANAQGVQHGIEKAESKQQESQERTKNQEGKGKQKAHTPPATPIDSILSFLFIGDDPYTLGYGPRPQSSNLKDGCEYAN